MKEDSSTKYLQFRMIHKRKVTNKKLCDMEIKENDLCPHCHDHVETIEYAFLQCKMAKKIWKEIDTWLQMHVNRHKNLRYREKNLVMKKMTVL